MSTPSPVPPLVSALNRTAVAPTSGVPLRPKRTSSASPGPQPTPRPKTAPPDPPTKASANQPAKKPLTRLTSAFNETHLAQEKSSLMDQCRVSETLYCDIAIPSPTVPSSGAKRWVLIWNLIPATGKTWLAVGRHFLTGTKTSWVWSLRTRRTAVCHWPVARPAIPARPTSASTTWRPVRRRRTDPAMRMKCVVTWTCSHRWRPRRCTWAAILPMSPSISSTRPPSSK